MNQRQNIYWSIYDPTGQHETRIADCSTCTSCQTCTVIRAGYNVSRDLYSSTTLKFLNTSLITSGSTLKCSQRNNNTNGTCNLFVVPDAGSLTLPQCNGARNIDIIQDQPAVVTCTGLKKSQGVYWSIIDPNDPGETVLGECDNCYSGCNRCRSIEVGFNVSRETEDTTTLKIMTSSLITSRWSVKCSERNNITEKSCTLFVVQAYRIPACSGDMMTVKDRQDTPVVCDGLHPTQSMYWTLTYGNGTVSTIATCTFCQPTCPQCIISDNDFNVSREDNSSTLVIQNNVRQKDGSTLTCSKMDNVTFAKCRIRVVSPQTNSETSSRLPVAAVAGGVVGVTFIVAVVVFIAVIIKHRRSSRGKPKGRHNLMHQNSEFEECANPNYQSVSDAELPIHDTTIVSSSPPSANHSSDAQGVRADKPENHVYAQVNKTRKNGREPETSDGQPGETSQGEQLGKGDAGCAVPVKKDNSSTNVYVNTAESPALGKDQDDQASKNSDYTNVPSTGENTYYNTAVTEGLAEYRNVQPTQNAAPGKTAESDDEYHRLRFARPSQQEENSTYNHLTEL